MRVVAVDALIACSLSPTSVPMTCHTAVGTMVVGFTLRTVALRAKSHGLIHLKGLPCSQMQTVRLVRTMTRRTTERAVSHLKSSVELLKLLRAIW